MHLGFKPGVSTNGEDITLLEAEAIDFLENRNFYIDTLKEKQKLKPCLVIKLQNLG